MEITVKGMRTLANEPVFVKTDNVPDNIQSAFDGDGNCYPAQKYNDGVIIIADIERNATKKYTLSEEKFDCGVEIDDFNIYIGGKYFTSYTCGDENTKPYLGPVMTSFGESFTRLDLQAKEHNHHRSVFLGIGDINGKDFWNENKQAFKQINRVIGGSAFAEISALNVWKSDEGVPYINEERGFIIYNQSDNCRYIDVTIKFTASYGDVKFGPTKEAGPLGIRVNEVLRVDKGTGRMVNSYGAESEAECWGRSASWCDYSGEINGNPCGIAVFDNESNERYPTAWHIRDYGLFAPNNFLFKGGFDIAEGESITYKYRICFHEGDVNISDRFVQYANQK